MLDGLNEAQPIRAFVDAEDICVQRRSTTTTTTELGTGAGNGRAAISRSAFFERGVWDAAQKCRCWVAATGISRHAYESPDSGGDDGATDGELHAAKNGGGVSVWRDDDGSAAAAPTSTAHFTAAAKPTAAARGDWDNGEWVVTAAFAGDGWGAGVGECSVGVVDERGGTGPERLSGFGLDVGGRICGCWCK